MRKWHFERQEEWVFIGTDLGVLDFRLAPAWGFIGRLQTNSGITVKLDPTHRTELGGGSIQINFIVDPFGPPI